MRLKLTVEYDGTGFRGWARQPGERTVEGELRRAVGALYGAADELAVAGRTDTGVHALANVVSVEVRRRAAGRSAPPGALNAVLPDDVAVVAAEQAAAGFHARFDARARSYRYRVWRRRERSAFEATRAALVAAAASTSTALNENAAALVGEHDFRAFTPTETQHGAFVRTVESARWIEVGRRRARVRGDGRLVPAPHGADARRDDARRAKSLRPLLEGRPRSEAGPPRRRTACTSRTCRTETSPGAPPRRDCSESGSRV